jgi:glutathione S-transferase
MRAALCTQRSRAAALSRAALSRTASAAAQPKPPLKYFSAWFCPFAHRATLALEHHSDAVPYAWEESLGWEQRQPTGNENFEAEEREDWWYHWKSPALLAANPLGMVPTILDEATGKAVGESLVCIQLVDEIAAANGGSAPSLLPLDPFERAQARVAAEQVNKTVCSAYYKVLVRPEDEQRRAAFADLKKGLLSFADTAQGDFWGGPTLGLVDCMLLPYAYRLYVLEHYRGKEFALPTSGEGGLWEKYHAWLDRATALPYVARTLPDKDRYLLHVSRTCTRTRTCTRMRTRHPIGCARAAS